MPAWPIPIHHTKFDDGEAPADRDVDAPDADAVGRTARSRRTATTAPGRSQTTKPRHQPSGVRRRQHDGGDLVGDRAERVARQRDRRLSGRGYDPGQQRCLSSESLRDSCANCHRLFDLRVRVAHRRQISRPRPRIQICQQAVIRCLRFHLRHPAVGIVDVAEDDRLRRAGCWQAVWISPSRTLRFCFLGFDLGAR